MGRRLDTATRNVWAASDEPTRLIVDSVRDYAIFMLDADGTVVSWSPGAEQLKGYTADQVVGRHFSLFYPPSDDRSEVCAAELESAAATGRFEAEGWRVRKDGTQFWANVVISAIRGREGELLGYAKVTRDLTERRNAEMERIRLARAEEAIRLRDEFLSIASHELKTPLASLQLELQALAQTVADNPVVSGKVARALRGAHRLIDLVSTLLDVSRIATGRFELRVAEHDLGAIAREVIGQFAERLARDEVELSANIAPELVGAWDRLRLEQVLVNLIDNALKYGDGSAVVVNVERRGEEAVIEVRDAGPGFPEQALHRVFARFERAASLQYTSGLGLGLYVVQKIARAHGGSASAQNLPGKGACVIVRLPLAAPSEEL